MKKHILILLLLFVSVSCVKLHTKYIEKNYFILGVSRPESDSKQLISPDSSYTVKILNIHAASDFRGTQFTYRIGANQYMSDYYNCFFVAPEENLQELIRYWFSKNNFFKYTLEDVSLVRTDFLIKPYLLQIYADLRDSDNPEAVILMAFSFMDNSGRRPAVIFSKDYAVRKSITDKSPQAIVNGWNECLGEILINFEKDVIEKSKEIMKGKSNE